MSIIINDSMRSTEGLIGRLLCHTKASQSVSVTTEKAMNVNDKC